jgi:ring-1,2-phenylacetyl-CoA epoxidase subunit PaaD
VSDVVDVVSEVLDPEIPVTLLDLGVIVDIADDGDHVVVTMRPTRLGCPGRSEMERRVRAAIASVRTDARVTVMWQAAGWNAEAVTSEGREALRANGWVLGGGIIRCPYCKSAHVRPAGSHGGSLCARPYDCRACGTPFDALASVVRS